MNAHKTQPSAKPSRTPGAKPCDPKSRVQQVSSALRALEKIGAPFSVADIAERSGIFRATIYRRPELRELVGARGDGARPVPQEVHERLEARHAALKKSARELRSRLCDLEKSWNEVRERAMIAERRLQEAEKKIADASHRASARANAGGALAHAAALHDKEQLRQARRQLAAALHPDRYAKDPVAAALASELLKALNGVVD